jgi:hypothetical protein
MVVLLLVVVVVVVQVSRPAATCMWGPWVQQRSRWAARGALLCVCVCVCKRCALRAASPSVHTPEAAARAHNCSTPTSAHPCAHTPAHAGRRRRGGARRLAAAHAAHAALGAGRRRQLQAAAGRAGPAAGRRGLRGAAEPPARLLGAGAAARMPAWVRVRACVWFFGGGGGGTQQRSCWHEAPQEQAAAAQAAAGRGNVQPPQRIAHACKHLVSTHTHTHIHTHMPTRTCHLNST